MKGKKYRILFVCHGNICRSPMAEFIMTKLVRDAKQEEHFYIDSKATSTEELGNAPYPPAQRKLNAQGVPMHPHRASQIKKSDYDDFDYIIGMDSANMRNMKRIFGEDSQGKLHKLTEYSSYSGDIEDPWYSGDFDTVYEQILDGCEGLLNHLLGLSSYAEK